MLKYEIDWDTLFRRGLGHTKPDSADILLICGRQGTGKSFAAVKFSQKWIKAVGKTETSPKVFANFSLKNSQRFYNLRELVSLDTNSSLVIIDEIFLFFVRHDKVDKLFLSWLAQSRKNNRTVVMISQDMSETPLVLRRFSKYLITCSSFGPFISENWSLGVTLAWDTDSQDWVASTYKKHIYRRTKSIASLYDTMEIITTDRPAPVAISQSPQGRGVGSARRAEIDCN